MRRRPVLLVQVAMRSEARIEAPMLEPAPGEGWPSDLAVLGDSRVACLVSGVGKVNAAASIGYALSALRPAAVINVGYCASLVPHLRTGSVVVPSNAVQYDYGHYEAGQRTVVRAGRPTIEGRNRPAAEAYFTFDDRLRDSLIKSLSARDTLSGELFHGREVCVASGDTFIADETEARRVYGLTGGSVVDMEAGAVAQVCAAAGVPAVTAKIVSDDACGDARQVYSSSLVDLRSRITNLLSAITESAEVLLDALAQRADKS